MAALLAVALTHDVVVWLNPVKPQFFLSDGKGFTRPIAPVDSPIVGDTELLEWAVKAAIAPYNVDYHNFAAELNTASRKFTLRGWNSFAASYVAQGNFDELKRARLLCHAQSSRAAVIHETTMVQGALAYAVQFPLVQTCENVNQVSTNNLLVTALVVRTNIDEHPDGLAIDELVASHEH